jgi:hypothetical protein
VVPPAARPGPVEPTGSVEFLDGGQPIDSCQHQPLANGGATCTVTYSAPGAHSITAQYLGDADFIGSSSPSELATAVADPPSGQSLLGPLGSIATTMRWTFFFTPSYTIVRNLVVNGAPTGSSVVVKCGGPGCPFVRHAAQVTDNTRCGKKTKRACPPPGTFNLTPGFASRHLGVGARVTVMVMLPNWVGRYYAFVVRARNGPRVQIGCLAPGVTGRVAPC